MTIRVLNIGPDRRCPRPEKSSRRFDGSPLSAPLPKHRRPADAVDRPVPARAQFPSADADSIATWASRIASITGQLKAQDAAFGGSARPGRPDAGPKAGRFFDRVAPALPVLLANMVSLGDIAVTYRTDIEQLLVLYPQGTAVMSSIVLAERRHQAGLQGRLPRLQPQPQPAAALQHRIPAGPAAAVTLGCTTLRSGPPVSCTAGCRRTRSLNVRGVRNIPCETSPAKRAPHGRNCAKATSSTSRSTTASTGRVTPTRPCRVRASRSTRRAPIRGAAHRRLARPATAGGAAGGAVLRPGDGRLHRSGWEALHAGRSGPPGGQELAVDDGARWLNCPRACTGG